MPRGSAPGERRGGRQKGVPNKITVETRHIFKRLFDDLDDSFADAMRLLATTEPEKFAELYLRMGEFAVPKLNRLTIDLTKLSLEELAQELARREAEAKAQGE